MAQLHSVVSLLRQGTLLVPGTDGGHRSVLPDFRKVFWGFMRVSTIHPSINGQGLMTIYVYIYMYICVYIYNKLT